MKIISLYSENFKRLKAVQITPDGNVVYISGKNGEGKSSVLDAIWSTLQHRATTKRIPVPLRGGTDNGKNVIDLGEYIVTRTYGQDGSTQLKIETPNGSIVKSPQRLLDGLVGDLSFDPWDFIRQDDKRQREILADLLFNLTNGKFNLSEFDARYQAAYDKRTDANKEQKRLTGIISSILPPTAKDPSSEVSIVDLSLKLEKAMELKKNQEEILALHAKIKTLEARNNELGNLNDESIKTEIQNIEKLNKRAREVILYQKIMTDLNDINNSIVRLNKEMELVKIEKEEALENSPLPVKGFTVTENGIMLANTDGHMVPFCQASSAQQLRVALAIAMAANPDLRVIRIADGSLLDNNSLKIIEEMASKEDFQIWVEYASRDSNDRIGVYIEDGTIVKN